MAITCRLAVVSRLENIVSELFQLIRGLHKVTNFKKFLFQLRQRSSGQVWYSFLLSPSPFLQFFLLIFLSFLLWLACCCSIIQFSTYFLIWFLTPECSIILQVVLDITKRPINSILDGTLTTLFIHFDPPKPLNSKHSQETYATPEPLYPQSDHEVS